MRLWKILGVATLAGVVAAGVAVERRRRSYRSYDTGELRAKLHARLADARPVGVDSGDGVHPLRGR